MKFRDQIHPSWQKILQKQLSSLDTIEEKLSLENFLPAQSLVLRALSYEFSAAKVLLLGQDPYPNAAYPVGLAFSVPSGVEKLPSSLKNIFKELSSDLGIEIPLNGDLSKWAEAGVVLLNRTLTCRVGESNSHVNIGWSAFTEACVAALAAAGTVGILWGNSAQLLGKYFDSKNLITSPHPSPLSAHRGFFGSKPFNRANDLLIKQGREPIDWSL